MNEIHKIKLSNICVVYNVNIFWGKRKKRTERTTTAASFSISYYIPLPFFLIKVSIKNETKNNQKYIKKTRKKKKKKLN